MHTIIKTASDCPEYRRIFVDTFSDEPSFKFMLPNDHTRKKHVNWIVDKKIKLFGSAYHTLTTQGQIKGFA